jgi:hypothetical protein
LIEENESPGRDGKYENGKESYCDAQIKTVKNLSNSN